MASVSVSHLIIFIAAMVVAGSVAGVLTTTVGDISNAIDDRGGSAADDIRADIEIINDPGAGVVSEDGDTLELYVKNTGSTQLTIEPENIDVFINGQFRMADEVEVVSEDEEVWGRNAVAQIDVDHDGAYNENNGEENRAKVVVEGAEDTLIWEAS